MKTIELSGSSGMVYTYYGVFAVGTSFLDVSANYIFARNTVMNVFVPVYIGETNNLSERIKTHEKIPYILAREKIFIFAHISSPNHQIRLDEETDLRTSYKPVYNLQ